MERNSIRNALKSLYFRLKKSMREKEFSFFTYQIVLETLFYERIKVKNRYESQLRRLSDENIVCIAFKFISIKYQSGWWKTSHNA